MTRPVFVYFLRPIGQDGPVKIGSSVAPEVRLATYMHWSPLPLEIAATLQVAKRSVEGRFHSAFRHLHTHHEWFRADPALTAAIDAIRAGTFDISGLPPTMQLYQSRDEYWTPERREARGLTFTVNRLARAANVASPPDVERALGRLRDCEAATREMDLAVVRRFISDPARYGKPHGRFDWETATFAVGD